MEVAPSAIQPAHNFRYGPVRRVCLFIRAELRLSPEDHIIGPRSTRRAMLARQIVAWIACHKHGLSLSAIGRVIQRDHTSIHHAVRSICDKRDANEKFRALTDDLMARAP